MSEDQFELTVKRYWEDLQGYSIDTLEHAFRRAPHPGAFPDWFPTLGQLVSLSEESQKIVDPTKLQLPEGDPWRGADGAAKAREILEQLNTGDISDAH